MSEAMWEVALVNEEGGRFVVARDVPTSECWAYLLAAGEQAGGPWVPLSTTEGRAVARLKDALRATEQKQYHGHRVPAVQLTRMDQTLEARREKWESDFYDIDRAGRRRRRYRRPKIEREWEEAMKQEARHDRESKRAAKAGSGYCPDCGAKWSTKAAEYGLVHRCDIGLVKDG